MRENMPLDTRKEKDGVSGLKKFINHFFDVLELVIHRSERLIVLLTLMSLLVLGAGKLIQVDMGSGHQQTQHMTADPTEK